MFIHDSVTRHDLGVETTAAGRWYVTPDGKRYPSVTTVLGWASDMSAIEAWREREPDADKIVAIACTRGEAVHGIAERYLRNDDWRRGQMPFNLATFHKLRPHLDGSIGKIRGLEIPLWSHELATAGRCDVAADWDGVPAIIDFKTARAPRFDQVIKKYLLQATAYSLMFDEVYGTETPRVVAVVGVDDTNHNRNGVYNDGEPVIVVRDRGEFIEQVRTIFSLRNRDKIA